MSVSDQVLDLALGPLFDPGVDLSCVPARSLNNEIDLSEFGIVVRSGEVVRKFGQEAITLLSPESIGPMQSVAPFFSVAVQRSWFSEAKPGWS